MKNLIRRGLLKFLDGAPEFERSASIGTFRCRLLSDGTVIQILRGDLDI